MCVCVWLNVRSMYICGGGYVCLYLCVWLSGGSLYVVGVMCVHVAKCACM